MPWKIRIVKTPCGGEWEEEYWEDETPEEEPIKVDDWPVAVPEPVIIPVPQEA